MLYLLIKEICTCHVKLEQKRAINEWQGCNLKEWDSLSIFKDLRKIVPGVTSQTNMQFLCKRACKVSVKVCHKSVTNLKLNESKSGHHKYLYE